MSRGAISHAVNGFFDAFRSKGPAPHVVERPPSRAAGVRVESRYNEGDDESLLESATSLPRPTLKALEKAIRADGFKGAQVSGWNQGQHGGFTVHYGGQQYEFEISENTTPRPVGEIGRLVKESGRYGRNGRGLYHDTAAGRHDMVLHQDHHGRWRIDLVTSAGGNHIDVTEREEGSRPNSGYSSAESAFQAALDIQRKRGIRGKSHVWVADRDGNLTDYEPMQTNGRRTGILSDGTRINVYHQPGTLDEYTVVPHSMDWDSQARGDMRSMLGTSATGLGFSQWTEGQEGRHLGRKLAWEEVPEELKRHIEHRVVGETGMVANARRKKGVTVDDLPTSTDTHVLACPECGGEFSAYKGDYFQMPKGEVLACASCEVPLQLRKRRAQRPTALDEGLAEDDYVVSVIDRDGGIGLFRVQRGSWHDTDPLTIGYKLDQISGVAESDARSRGVQDAVIWDGDEGRQIGHVLHGRWKVQ